MENIDSTFRLFSLPKKPFRNVFRIMDLNDTVAISLCSNSSWGAISQLKLPVKAIKTVVSHLVSVMIFSTNTVGLRMLFCDINSAQWVVGREELHLDRLSPVHVIFQYGTFDNDLLLEGDVVDGAWEKTYSYIDWMDHLLHLFDVAEQDKAVFEEASERFNIPSVKKVVDRGLNNLYSVANACSDEFHQHAHRNLQPIHSILLDRIPYPKLVDYYRLILQNFINIELDKESVTKLDTLLLTNAFSTLIWQTNTISSKDINRYLKLWTKGGNPRLEFLFIDMDFDSVLDIETVLKGLKYQTLPEDREEVFYSVTRVFRIKGGYQIRSRSWKRANIRFIYDVDDGTPCAIQMCVFH